MQRSVAGEPFLWMRNASAAQRKTLLAASLGWMLDSMDVMLYALALPAIRSDLHMSIAAGGLIMSGTLVAGAMGGVLFGVVADRLGRMRALTMTVLLYSLCTALCALARTPLELGVFRVLLGLGMGGEWAAGAALVAESWPADARGKALALVQSAWAIGYGLAALLVAVVLPHGGWRVLFVCGAAPGLVALWVRRGVKEPEHSRGAGGEIRRGSLRELLSERWRGRALLFTVMNAATLFAYWGLFFWVPQFLAGPKSQGGHGLTIVQTAYWAGVMQVGTFFGYVSFGVFADAWSRKWTYVTYLCAAALVVPFYAQAQDARVALWLGPVVGFFGAGYFSGFSVMASENFPYAIRGLAMGLCYNLGRVASAAAPYSVGRMFARYGMDGALAATSLAFLAAALLALLVREQRRGEDGNLRDPFIGR